MATGKKGTKLNEDLVMNWKIKNLDYKSFILLWPWIYTPFGKSQILKQKTKNNLKYPCVTANQNSIFLLSSYFVEHFHRDIRNI